MNKHLSHLLVATSLALSVLIAGCSTTPTIKESKVGTVKLEKVTYIHLVFRDLPMTTEPSSVCNGCKAVTEHSDDLSFFGAILASDAYQICAKRGINVLSTRVDNGSNQRVFLRTQPDGKMPPVLVITPISGKIFSRTTSRWSSSESKTTRKADYVFSVQLIDYPTRSELWSAKIDTSGWGGPIGTVAYNEEYVVQFLNVVLDQMAKDNLL